MPTVIFHQNMRTFGGGNEFRVDVANYVLGFAAASRNFEIKIAGLTEITNNGVVNGVMPDLHSVLLRSQNPQIFNICCGISAVGGRSEYTSIGVHETMTIMAIGRVYKSMLSRRIEIDSIDMDADVEEIEKWCDKLPEHASADHRYIVYTIVRADNGENVAFAFMHNIYTNGAIRVYEHLMIPGYLHKIKEEEDCVAVFIGGDFNARPPLNFRNRAARKPYRTYQKGMDVDPAQWAPRVFSPGGTTRAGSLYDYWYSDSDNNDYCAHVHPEAIEYGLSDHCGISLKIE
ncbi:MAG TPA: endonuclease/exonuclease/phosphatase family protein [Chitinophagaceae bacterium]|nr:endonuclease/exonuclease/phosphatase family protein [Chitinophagaceae bacterium]